MIAINYNDSLGKTLTALAESFPAEMPKSIRDVGNRLRNRMVREMREGTPAGQTLAPLNALTIDLKAHGDEVAYQERRRKLGKKAKPHTTTPVRLKRLSREFGGELPGLIEWHAGDGAFMRVGFLGLYFQNTEKWAEMYQSEKDRPFTRFEREMIRTRLGNDYKQPEEYEKPERQVIAPYGNDPDLKKDIVDTITKSISAQIENANRKK